MMNEGLRKMTTNSARKLAEIINWNNGEMHHSLKRFLEKKVAVTHSFSEIRARPRIREDAYVTFSTRYDSSIFSHSKISCFEQFSGLKRRVTL